MSGLVTQYKIGQTVQIQAEEEWKWIPPVYT